MRSASVIRFLNRHRQGLFVQMLFDYGALVLMVLGAMVLLAGTSRDAMPHGATTHAVSLATWLFFVSSASGVYEPSRESSWGRTFARVLLVSLLVLPLAYLLFRLLPSGTGYEGTATVVAMIGVAMVVAHRVYATHRAPNRVRHKMLIVGAGTAAQLVGKTLQRSSQYVDVVGYYPSPNEEQLAIPKSQLLVPNGTLAAEALALGVKEIVVAVSERRGGSMPMRDLLECKIYGMKVWDITTYFEKCLGQIRLDYVNASWLIFGDGFKQGLARTLVKRLFDLIAATVLLITAAPIMVLTAAAIALEGGGAILYRQKRVGFNGSHFDVLKFRSMRPDAEKDGSPQWACQEDDRVTKVGRFIRRLRIDELPQLFNVLAGEMSIVGPRPERPYFVDRLTAEIPYYAVRHSIKPGVTGWAQVRYHYGATVEDAQEKLQYDLYYVKNHSLMLDLLILLETVAVVLTGKGAR
jgi:sugar transferase (PEP-CTERM system associated)